MKWFCSLFIYFLSSIALANIYNFNFYNDSSEQGLNENPVENNSENMTIEKSIPTNVSPSQAVEKNDPAPESKSIKYWRFGVGASHKSYLGLKATDRYGLGRSDSSNHLIFKVSYGRKGGFLVSPYLEIGKHHYDSKFDMSNNNFTPTEMSMKSMGFGIECKKEFLLSDDSGIFVGAGLNYVDNSSDFYKNTRWSESGMTFEDDIRIKIKQAGGSIMAGSHFYFSNFVIELAGAMGLERSSLDFQQLFYDSNGGQHLSEHNEKYAQLSASLSTMF